MSMLDPILAKAAKYAGSLLKSRPTWRFEGAGVSVYDDATTGETAIAIVGGSSTSSALANTLAATSGSPGQVIVVSGNSSQLDGGSGHFVNKLLGSDTPNGGTIFASPIGTYGWYRMYTGDVYASWFGLTLSTGSTAAAANLAAITAAGNLAAANLARGKHCTLQLPAGTYVINGTGLDFGGVAIRICGQGADITTIKVDASVSTGSPIPFVLRVGDPVTASNPVYVMDLTLDSNGRATNTLQTDNMPIRTNLQRIKAKNAKNANWLFNGSMVSATVDNLEFNGGAYGLLCANGGNMSGMIVNRVRFSGHSVMCIDITNATTSSQDTMDFRSVTCEGNNGGAVRLQGGFVCNFFGGHFEQNGKVTGDADFTMGRYDGGSTALCQVNLIGCQFSTAGAAQSNVRWKFAQTGARLIMVGTETSNSDTVDAASFTGSSRVVCFGLTNSNAYPTLINGAITTLQVFPGLTNNDVRTFTVTAGAVSVQSIAVTGAAYGDTVNMALDQSLGSCIPYTAWVSSPGNVSWAILNPTGADITFTSVGFYARVMKGG